MSLLKDFIDAASTAEREALAEAAGTTVNHLRFQLGGGHRHAGPELAARLERAAEWLRLTNPALPPLLRTDLCAACAGCDLAHKYLPRPDSPGLNTQADDV